MWSLLSWNKQETEDCRWIFQIGRDRHPRDERYTHVFDEELRKVLVVIKTFLQLANEEPDKLGREALARGAPFALQEADHQPTLCASRRSGECSRRRSCLFLSCRRGRLFPRSSSWSPAGWGWTGQINSHANKVLAATGQSRLRNQRV